MSIKVLNNVWQHSKQEGGALLVLLAIADFADDKGQAFPSVDTISKKARLTERHTQRVIRKLQSAGELQVKNAAGPYGCNLYTVRIGLVEGDNMSPVTSDTGGVTICTPPLTFEAGGGDAHATRSVIEPNTILGASELAPGDFSLRGQENVSSSSKKRTKATKGEVPPTPEPPTSPEHGEMIKTLSDLFGPIPDHAAQGAAVKWLLKYYTKDDCVACLTFLAGEKWRTTSVSWLTVKKEIGNWKNKTTTPKRPVTANGATF